MHASVKSKLSSVITNILISTYSYCHHYSKSKAQEGIPDCIQYAAKVRTC